MNAFVPPMVCRGLSRTTSKIGVITVEDISKSVHAIILAGGSSDNPLARYRAMPAVELGTAHSHSSTSSTEVVWIKHIAAAKIVW